MLSPVLRSALMFLAAGLLQSQAQASTPQLSGSDLAVIEELYHLWSAKANEVWATARNTQIPIFYIKSDFEYAIGFPRALDGFSSFSVGLLRERSVQVRARTFSTDLSASFPVGGVPAVVIGSFDHSKRSPEDWVIVAEHEMFHVFQAGHGSYAKIASLAVGAQNDPSWMLTFPFPYSDSNVMRLIHLQGYSLWLCANSRENDGAVYNVRTALDAAEVYCAYLERSSNSKSYLYSEIQEWNEGVAKYAEYRFAECASQGDYIPTTLFRALPASKGYVDLWNSNYQNLPFLVKHAGRAAQNRNAFYHLGLGKALALDRVYPDWKKRYFDNGLWLDDLLRLAMTHR